MSKEISEVAEDVTSKLSNLLTTMKDWERKPIVKVGRVVVELVKLPRRELKKRVEPERLALHIRLEDSFKGIFLEESREFEDLVAAVSAKLVKNIAKSLDEVNRRRVIEYGI